MATALADPRLHAQAEQASQWRLMWWAFRRHRLAMAGMIVVGLLYLVAAFTEFLAPFDPEAASPRHVYHPPQLLRFIDVQPDSAAHVLLEFRDASRDRGTEIVARVSAPAPGLLTGPLTFKALYRARALLQTGEVPTLHHNSSARASDR